jgi:ABC-type transport system substrate-binding protein
VPPAATSTPAPAARGTRDSGSGAAAVATATAPPAAKAKYGGTLRSSVISSGIHDDYQQQTGAQLGLNTSMAYSGLLKFKHGPAIKPGTYISEGDLAESWEQPDDLTYVFKLRRGVKFQNLKPVNGREATSADVQYSYQRVIDLKTVSSLLAGVQKMETLDPYTLKITLAEPNADFLTNISTVVMYIVAKEAVEVNGDLKNGPHVGTGPWMVESVTPGTRECYLVRNPDYFIKGLPYVDRLEFLRIPDPATVISAFRAKQLDIIGGGTTPDVTDPIAKANPNEITLVNTPFFNNSDEFAFKTDRPPFNDPRVRKAVVLAMDREALIQSGRAGFAYLTSGVITPDPAWQLPSDTLKQLYKRDVAAARQLLAQAGQPDLTFELTVPTYISGVFVTMGEQLQQQLKEAGIAMTLKSFDTAGYNNAVQMQGNFTAYFGSAGGRITANQDLLNRFHSKGPATNVQTKYNNPQLDTLIDQQKVLSRDPVKRRALLEQIQRQVIEDNVIIGVGASIQQNLRWSYMKDFYVYSILSESNPAWIDTWVDK